MRWAAVIAVLALAGCGGSAPARPAPSASPPATVASLTQPSQRCGTPAMAAKLVRLKTADGVALDGAEVGAGPHGAVFLHESPGDLCVWWPFASALEKAGVHALLLDLRCYGQSDCPQGYSAIDPADDVAAGIAQLRRDGAERVAVVGASYGGASALVAASRLKVDGVASLSGEPDLQPQLDVDKVIGHLRAPLFMAVSTGDSYVSPAQARTMVRDAGSAHKRLLIRPRDAGHGVQMLVGDDGYTPNALFAALVSFIRSV